MHFLIPFIKRDIGESLVLITHDNYDNIIILYIHKYNGQYLDVMSNYIIQRFHADNL